MTLNRGMALLPHPHSRLLLRGPEFDALAALRAAIARLRQMICGLGGHEYSVHSADHRMFLECVRCGRETRGWRIDVNGDLQRSTIAERIEDRLYQFVKIDNLSRTLAITEN